MMSLEHLERTLLTTAAVTKGHRKKIAESKRITAVDGSA